MEQETLLRKIAAALEQLGIPYLITGGLAVTVWGRPRFTADIDIVVEIPRGRPKNLSSLCRPSVRTWPLIRNRW